MSFPTIPDINPEINIKREDAVNLLLISIALEEISLSDLIDAEVKKICCVVKDCENTHSINDIKDINRSVDQTLKDIIKLQMLLQFKLENVQEITSTSSTTTSTSTTTTTTTHTTTHTTTTSTTHTTTTHTTSTSTTTTTSTKTTTTNSTTSTKTTTTAKKKCRHCLTSKAKGCVSKKCDFFFGGTANLRTSICNSCCGTWKSLLSYCVRKNDMIESIEAFPCGLKTKCHSIKNPYAIKIIGTCSIVRKACSQQDITDTGSFKLMIWNTFWAKCFRMVITADNNPSMNHDSGKVFFKDFSLF